jgi:hypothetical protein
VTDRALARGAKTQEPGLEASLVVVLGTWVCEKAKAIPGKNHRADSFEINGRWARRDGNITPPADRTKPAKGKAHERRRGRNAPAKPRRNARGAERCTNEGRDGACPVELSFG